MIVALLDKTDTNLAHWRSRFLSASRCAQAERDRQQAEREKQEVKRVLQQSEREKRQVKQSLQNAILRFRELKLSLEQIASTLNLPFEEVQQYLRE